MFVASRGFQNDTLISTRVTPHDHVRRRCRTVQGEFSVPYAAHDIFNQREKLREQREHVLLVVKSYNSEQEHHDYDAFLSTTPSLLLGGVL